MEPVRVIFANVAAAKERVAAAAEHVAAPAKNNKPLPIHLTKVKRHKGKKLQTSAKERALAKRYYTKNKGKIKSHRLKNRKRLHAYQKAYRQYLEQKGLV